MKENKKHKTGYTKLEDDNKKLKKDLEQLKEFVTKLKCSDDTERPEHPTDVSLQYDLEM